MTAHDEITLDDYAPAPEFDPAERVATLQKVRPDAGGVLVVSRGRYNGDHPAHVDGVLVVPAGDKQFWCRTHDWTEERSTLRSKTKCCRSKDTLMVAKAGDDASWHL